MTEHVVYQYDEESKIHSFRFLSKGRAAADAYVDFAAKSIGKWIEDGLVEQPFRLLIDISESGLFPLKYTIDASTKRLGTFEKLPPRYLAYITEDITDISLLKQLGVAAGRDWTNTRQIFAPSEIEEARQWLASIE